MHLPLHLQRPTLLYGVLDGGVVVSKAKKADTKVQAKSGFDSGSRWGLKALKTSAMVIPLVSNSNKATILTMVQQQTAQVHSQRKPDSLYKGGFGTLSFGRFGSLASGAGTQTILTGWQFGTSYEETGSWTKYGKEEITVSTMLFLMFLQPSAEQLCMPCIPTACLMMIQNGPEITTTTMVRH